MSIKIRNFKIDDSRRIKEMIKNLSYLSHIYRCKKEKWPVKKIKNFEFRKYKIKRKFSGKNIILIAEHDKKFVGMCWLTIHDYGPEKQSEIAQLYVDKEFRNEKIGYKLIKKAKEILKKENVDVLLVSTCINKAKKFYKKCGFKQDKCYWLFWTPEFGKI